jgi:hypothetical protein
MKPAFVFFSLLAAMVIPTSVVAEETSGNEAPTLHPILIEHPPTLGKLTTELRDAAGRPIGIECATCHGGANALASRADAPSGFHSGIELGHGDLTCDSCHAPSDRTRLRLANGETLEMEEVIRLCSQCHGTQYRSFQNLAHGGSRGYWDRTKGPVVRNSCVACHAAHRPAYPLVRPAAPPNDRFLTRPHDASTESAAHSQSPGPESRAEATHD